MNELFKVGVYIRLSKEDLDKVGNYESESIKNQRKLIYKYLADEHFSVIEEYIDDGYSGTTFERPSFIRLIKDIKNKKINMVITKDLSRLGRDYIKTGYYLEEFFPNHKVRYISILDGIDTYLDSTNNDIAPFKALFNDMISKDTSKKIKSILKNKKEQGLYLGSKAPYGYLKDPNNKHKLIIDSDKSKVVKKIFGLALRGTSNLKIADILNEEGVLSPNKKHWSTSSVYNILNNQEYTGCVVSNVWTNVSYKNKNRIKRSQDQWIIFKDKHEKIIDEEVYFTIKNKKRRLNTSYRTKQLLLEGMVSCEECGSLLGASYLKKRGYYVMVCNRYKKNSHSCTSHYIKYQELENIVLKKANHILKKINNRQIITLKNKVNGHSKINEYQNKRERLQNKLNYLYEDRLNEIINLEMYKKLSLKIKSELDSLELAIKKIQSIQYEDSGLIINRELLSLLIEKVTISNSKKIKIAYRFKMLSPSINHTRY